MYTITVRVLATQLGEEHYKEDCYSWTDEDLLHAQELAFQELEYFLYEWGFDNTDIELCVDSELDGVFIDHDEYLGNVTNGKVVIFDV